MRRREEGGGGREEKKEGGRRKNSVEMYKVGWVVVFYTERIQKGDAVKSE